MRMGYGLYLEQTQKLVMTPELRQAITILQLSSQELQEFLEQEILENPVLELEELRKTAEKKKEEYDEEWLNYFQNKSDLGLPKPMAESPEDDYSYENFVASVPTLWEHLHFQLHMADLSAEDHKIGEYLLGLIDERGYFTGDIADVAASLKISKDRVEKILGVIQGFEPAGVGARNLTECLLIQYRQREQTDPLVETLIANHLAELGEGKYPRLAEKLGVTPREIQKAADLIKTLDPKPGRNFSGANEIRYITPDVIVERVDGEYVVIVNDNSAPRLSINPVYQQLVKEQGDESIQKFIADKIDSAVWLIKSIEQRRMTLYKVTETIVRLQREFFDKGIRYLKPLTLREVAEEVGVHESTVSRATTNKFVQTPRGVFELKFFFTSGVQTSAGEGTSAESAKKIIEDLVKEEDPQNPLSDQAIADLMKAKGIHISRRTVAKYRDDLGIPPSAKRKRY